MNVLSGRNATDEIPGYRLYDLHGNQLYDLHGNQLYDLHGNQLYHLLSTSQKEPQRLKRGDSKRETVESQAAGEAHQATFRLTPE